MKKIIFLTIAPLMIIILIGFFDANNYDNFLYQYLRIGPLNYYDLPIWDFFMAVGTIVTTIVAVVALRLTHETGIFDKTPNVLASGTFIISTKNKKEDKNRTTNDIRDMEIDTDCSVHTFQLINIGRGLAKNIIPSIREEIKGKFLEDISPHSFILPSGKSTRDLGEVLRVHGQIFEKGQTNETIETEDENDAMVGWFYIYFKDHSERTFKTKVKIKKVKNIDKSILGGRTEELIKNPDIEIWKVIDNIKVEI